MNDRTLSEILDAAKVGEPTTHDECLYALLAVSALSTFDKQSLRELAFHPLKFRTPTFEAEESFRRWKLALARPPREWLGAAHDPANDECRERVRMARNVIDRLTERRRREQEDEADE